MNYVKYKKFFIDVNIVIMQKDVISNLIKHEKAIKVSIVPLQNHQSGINYYDNAILRRSLDILYCAPNKSIANN